MRRTALETIHHLARQDPRVVFLGSDITRSSVLEAFQREFPDRFLMEGVCEANLIGIMAGLAMSGKIPYLNTIATFLTRRCYDQVAVDACLHRLPLRLVGSGGGLVYAPLGPTHLAIEDLAIMRALPSMTVVAPADALEMRRLMLASLDLPGPLYVRMGKGGERVVTADDGPFVFGRAVPMREGRDVLLVTTGVMLQGVLQAADELAAQGIEAAVLHLPTVKPLDGAALAERSAGVRGVLVVEEHSVVGGLGSAVAEALAELPDRPPVRRLGIPDVFPDRYGSQEELFAYYGLDPQGIAAAARRLVGG
jgi:transketolase